MPIPGHKATLSNLGTSLAGATERTSIQILTDARNAKDSGQNPFLEHDRIREIRQLPAEETFDLVTDCHHFIAEGIVVHNCDIRINNDLEREGSSFYGVEDCWKDKSFDDNGIAAEEDIYDLITNQCGAATVGSWGDPSGEGDMIPLTNQEKQQAINTVVQAVHQAKLAGQAGNLPGSIEATLNKFLEPVIAWQTVLMQFFTDLLNEDYSWKRPNRRYNDMYLPSRFTDDGRLEHLIYYLDVSGSVTDAQALRFNSEVKYIQEVLKPQRLTLVQFDTCIQDVKEFKEEDPFDEIKIIGRGGTSFEPVREHMLEHRPTAAIVFSDMWCEPMQPLNEEIPIIWVAINNRTATVPFGKLIHIK